jgi:hypothetical protein
VTSYAADIKPLFRDKDIQSMGFRFHLDRFEDVSDYADQILERLRAGDMPCDGTWPAEQVELFASWVSGGKQP